MRLDSIHNGRGFFSDYWLGSVLAARRGAGPHLAASQTRKLMYHLSRLRQRVDRVDPLPIAEFREKFARPFLSEVFGYLITEGPDDPRVRLLCDESGSAGDRGHEPEVAGAQRREAVRVPGSHPPIPAQAAYRVPGSPEGSDQTIRSAVLMNPEDDGIDSRALRNKINSVLLDYDLDYGLILTPTVLRLVRRPGEGHKNAYFDFSFASAVESEDNDSLRVAFRILSVGSLAPGEDGVRPIEILESESRKHSARVSEDLKEAVFTSAEAFIKGFLNDIHRRPDVFGDTPALARLRDAALLTLYRLLFIFYAESRDERLQGHSFYLESYSLERLIGRIMNTKPCTIAGNRCGCWARILALFQIYDEGIQNIPDLENIPPRGGELFSSKTHAGTFISKVRLPDTVLVDILLRLGTARPRCGVGRERISFRELAIEQLGAVYEGLLEYEPRIADEMMIKVRVQGKTYVLTPPELCRLCREKQLILKGPIEIVEGTDAAAFHPGLEEYSEEEQETIQTDNDEEDSIRRNAPARLLERIGKGDFYFVPGSVRKATGSYYTHEEIVQYLVRNALQNLVEDKSSADIESLRVIDPACGSAHFLVGAARYLGTKLLDAYAKELKGAPPQDFYPGMELTPNVRERWEKEGEPWCKRRIVERCLFGVDVNPTAVQLARVALWIESLAGDRPLSFFAHHIRCGNSLLGTWIARLHDAPHPSYDRKAVKGQKGLFEQDIDKAIADALDQRLLIDADLPAEVPKDTPHEYDYKEDCLHRAEETLAHARLLFDLRNAAAFVPEIWGDWRNILQAGDLHEYAISQSWREKSQEVRDQQRFFHWELEFPEVFRGEKKGFDAVLGNPPWEKIKPDRKEFYGRADILIRAYTGGELDVRIRELHKANARLEGEFEGYQETIKTTAACLKKGGDYEHCDWVVNGRTTGGDPDLFKFFLERGHRILRVGGRLGFLVPSAIYNNEGCTGLRHLIFDRSQVKAFYGFENRRKIFNIDSRYKFVCLVLERGHEKMETIPDETGTGSFTAPPSITEGRMCLSPSISDTQFPAAFMRHDLQELESGPPEGVQVIIKRSEIEKLSPGTLAFLEYRSERDREIILKMYGLLPGMEPRPLLGDQGPGTWNARFYREFDMTNDRDLWTKPDGTLWTPKEVCGLDWPRDSSTSFSEVRAAMAKQGFWPLYEGKHIEQFLIDIKPIERWVSLEKAKKKYGHEPDSEPKLVFRDIASNTNERTCICAVLPAHSCSGHTLGTLRVNDLSLDQACMIMNSFTFDFATRLKTGGTHLTWTHICRLPIPASRPMLRIPPVTTATCESLSACPAVADHQPSFKGIWDVNKSAAGAYGLTPSDFEHALSTFPVFARKRPEFHTFLREQVAGWKESL